MIYAAQLRYLAQIAPKSPFFTRDALSGMTFVRAQKLSITVLPGTMHHAPRTTHVALGNSSKDEGDVTENGKKAPV